MLRSLYRCVLSLHPFGFRKRFADEMLSIFDQATGKLAAVKLLLDGFVSLLRQWTLRPEFWQAPSPAQQPAPNGIPSFHTLDPFRPRAGAVIHGLLLSTAIFCLTCFAIRYSWIHVLHVHIPKVRFDSPQYVRTNAGSGGSAPSPTLAPHSEPVVPPAGAPSASNVPPKALPAASAVLKRTVKPSSARNVLALAPSPAVPRTIQSGTAKTTAANDSREGTQLPAAASSPVTQISLRSHVGIYIAGPPSNLAISITTEGDHLMLTIVGQPKRELAQVSEMRFVARGTDHCWIEFSAGGQGKGDEAIRQKLQLFQNGQQFTLWRQ